MSKYSDISHGKRNVRKVHFELPTTLAINGNGKCSTVNHKRFDKFDQHPNKFVITTKWDENKVHGTANYVNGTLNFTMADYEKAMPNNGNSVLSTTTTTNACTTKNKPIESRPIIFRNELTNDASAKNARKNCSIDQQYWDNAVVRRGILLHVSAENQEANNITFRKNKIRRYTSILMGPTNYFKRSRRQLLKNSKLKRSSSSNTLELPTNQPQRRKPAPKFKQSPFEKFSYKLFPIKSMQRKRAKVDNSNEAQPFATDFDERALSIVRNALSNRNELGHQCTSEQLSEILQLAHRWQPTTHSMHTSDNVSIPDFGNSVEFCTLKKLDVKM